MTTDAQQAGALQAPAAPGIWLTPAGPDDAAFLVAQRRHPRAAPFLGDTSADLAAQRAWLAAQAARPSDAYFVGRNAHGVPLGSVGLYNRDGEVAEWGRFLVRPGSKAAPALLLAILRLAFDELGLAATYCQTVAHNDRAIAFYERAGFAAADAAGAQVVLGGVATPLRRHVLPRARWPQVARTLTLAATAKAVEVAREREAADGISVTRSGG